MSLTKEWEGRIERWKSELQEHFYYKLAPIELSGFTTTEQIPANQISKYSFKPMPAGTRWGGKWEYGWFKGEVRIPESAKDKRLVLNIETGGESAVFISGRPAGARDKHHSYVTLSKQGSPGRKYEIMIETYAGHGPRNNHAGPTPPGRLTVPEPESTQTVIGETSFGIWQEDVYQLYLDVETLWQIRNNINQESLRTAEIDQALRDFTLILDFELDTTEMLATVHQARARLKPLLECTNGSTAPTLFACGHAHLDVAWLWPLAETERKCLRTFSTQLALMEEYPEYKFLQSQPCLFEMVKNSYPDFYEELKKAVRNGQLIPEGGMWVEADTNISGGESLIRQFIHGKTFLQQEFEVESEILWLPDVFGYSGALPQIMRGCGIKYFSTAKLFWDYHGGEKFPYNTFTWEGIDGSEVLVHLCNDYNSRTDPGTLIERWEQRRQKDGYSTRLLPFGWGDGGGGATRDHLEYLRRQRDLEGVPRTRIARPIEYFKDQEAKGIPEARYVGELYFHCHRGTYTSQARTKKGNRKSEFSLREAELWGGIATVLTGFSFPRNEIKEAWKKVLLNQFHDVLPGSSINRVHQEAETGYGQAIATAEKATRQALAELVEDNKAVTVFNSLSWRRTELITLPDEFEGARDDKGQPLPIQELAGKTMAQVELPGCGWTTVLPGDPVESNNKLKAGTNFLENEKLKIEFDDKGGITRIHDKEIKRDLSDGTANCFQMYKDVPVKYDAWDIESNYQFLPVKLDEPADMEVVAAGPLTAKLRVKRKLNQSCLTQDISLRANSRRVDFETSIDWREKHKLLKVAFPVNIRSRDALHEIQFGYLDRPTHSSRQADADRFEVSNQKWTALREENRGFAVLNDCKYGVNVTDSTIKLTLLKSPLAPDMTADQGKQDFTYAFYAWNGSLAESSLVNQAYELNSPVSTEPGAGGEKSIFKITAENIILETVKPAEDGSGDLILRLYESKRMAVDCGLIIDLPFNRAIQCDMMENNQAELKKHENKIELDFKAFEVKTIRLTESA